MKRAMAICGLGLLCLGGALLLLFQQGYRFNLTPSMPRGIYRLAGVQRIERGDLVSLCLSGSFSGLARERGYLGCGSCPDGSKPLLKIVAGLPGDMVDPGPEGIRINGQLQPCSKPRAFDREQRPMPAALDLVRGHIPDGLVLALSDRHSGGFDSRYFGLVPMTALQKVQAVRVFTPKGKEGKTRE